MEAIVTKPIYEAQSVSGITGTLSISIGASGSQFDVDALSPEDGVKIKSAAREAHRLLESAILEVIYTATPECQKLAAEERKEIVKLFTGLVWMEPIPNQTPGNPESIILHWLPWFRVTTVFGIFIIGWRRQVTNPDVIHIDWEGVPNTQTAKDLFADERTTKVAKSINAHGYLKAFEYISKIKKSAMTYAERGEV